MFWVFCLPGNKSSKSWSLINEGYLFDLYVGFVGLSSTPFCGHPYLSQELYLYQLLPDGFSLVCLSLSPAPLMPACFKRQTTADLFHEGLIVCIITERRLALLKSQLVDQFEFVFIKIKVLLFHVIDIEGAK